MSAATRTGIANLPLHYGKAPPVDRPTYDQSIDLLRKAMGKSKLGLSEKRETMNRLGRFVI